MRFADIPGHSELKAELRSLVDNNRLPHALLFTGAKGSGKLALSIALASYIQCEGDKTDDKCNSCNQCRKTGKHIHPDISFVLPTISEGSKSSPSSKYLTEWREILTENPFLSLVDWLSHISAKDKQPNIAKVSIQEFIDYYNYGAREGQKRISIIWNAELLAKEGNRLLKLIEEPPKDAIIILNATDISKVLPTIISRCQVVRVPPFTDEELISWGEKLAGNNQNLANLSQISEGNINVFRKMLSDVNTDLFKDIVAWFRMCYVGDSKELLKFSEDFAKLSKDNQKLFFKNGLNLLGHILHSYYLPKEKIGIFEEEYQTMIKIRNVVSEEKLSVLVAYFDKNIYYIERNANSKILIFTTSLFLNKILRG